MLLNALGFGYCLALVLALLVAGLVGTVIERPLLCRVYRLGTAILALSSSAPTTTFYTLRNGNYGADLTRFTLSGGLAAGGTDNTVAGGTSQDVRGLVFDPVNAKWYYGTAGGAAPRELSARSASAGAGGMPTPEPASLALLGASLFGLGLLGWRRNRM